MKISRSFPSSGLFFTSCGQTLWVLITITGYMKLNKNTLGVKKVRGQSEAALQIGTYVRPKTLISVEAKKLLIRNLFNYLNGIQ